MDSVFCPTGFFTSRYTVADITEHLEVCIVVALDLTYSCYTYCTTTATVVYFISIPVDGFVSLSQNIFRTVDGYYVDNAIKMVHKTILPHMMQAIGLLNTQTSEQRSAIAAEELIGPLDVLFEFGEMDAAIPADQSLRPTALFGAHTKTLGEPANHVVRGETWQKRTVQHSLHVVMEASEPSSGLRYVAVALCMIPYTEFYIRG